MATKKPFQSIIITTDSSSVTFFGIDSSYTDLEISISGANTAGANNCMRFNSDEGANYGFYLMSGYDGGGTREARGGANLDRVYIDNSGVLAYTGSGNVGVNSISIANYSSSTNYKQILARSNGPRGTDFTVNEWRSNSPITSITLFPSTGLYKAGTTFDLYGINSGAPKAFGGDVVATDGNYWYHAFKSSGRFTPQYPISCDVLVVAGGGGGGGGGSGGGGGAGGIFYATSQSLSLAQTVTIGAGGASDTRGINSVFGSLTAAVGGGGGGSGVDGLAGGSGGGAYPGQIGGATTQTSTGGTGYGNAGGNGGAFTSPYSSGGGGGAGAAGAAGNSGASQSGAGGAGLNTWSSWASITGTGASGYFAGGGGGGANAQYGGNNGAGGAGGGGAGATPGTAGTANTGGGGGGSRTQPSGAGTGGLGGSGIVIVRYAV
jgi:hypothetical protein